MAALARDLCVCVCVCANRCVCVQTGLCVYVCVCDKKIVCMINKTLCTHYMYSVSTHIPVDLVNYLIPHLYFQSHCV